MPGCSSSAVDRVAAAVDEVDDARRDLLDRVDQLDDQRRRPRVELGRLEDEGVAAGDRVGQEPERDHRREVEGRDRGDDADRLADQLDVDAGGDALEGLALQQVRDRRRRLDRLDPAADLAVGVGQRLAHVGVTSVDSSSRRSQQLRRAAPAAPAPACCGGIARQAGCAARAAATAAPTSAAPISGTCAETSRRWPGSTSASVSTPSTSIQAPPT